MVDAERKSRLPNLKAQRTSLRSQVTRLVDKVHQCVEYEDFDALQISYKSLQKVSKRLDDIDLEWNNLQDPASADFDEETIAQVTYIEKISTAETEYETCMSKLKLNESMLSQSGHSCTNANNITLEKLVLPNFNGDCLKFLSFWQVFRSRIHKNNSLSIIDKYEYLKSKLTGDAAKAIDGLPFTNSGYEQAMSILLRRFGNKTPLINAHMQALAQLPPVDDCSDVVGLRKLSDSMVTNVRALEILGVNLKETSKILGPILLGRLPLLIRVAWEEKEKKEEPEMDELGLECVSPIDVSEFLEFLCRQVDIWESGHRSGTASGMDISITPKHPKVPRKSVAAVSALLNSSNTVQCRTYDRFSHNRNLHCVICSKSDHLSYKQCKMYQEATPQSRHDMVKKAKCCFNCLSSAHHIKQCTSKLLCQKCNGKHHSTLCTKDMNKDPPLLGAASSTTLLCSGSNNLSTTVILQTLRVCAHGPAGDKPIRMLLDGCSSRTFVRRKVVSDLNVPILRTETLLVNSFNQGSVQKRYDVCELPITAIKGGEVISVVAYVCENICNPIPSLPVDFSQLSYLHDLTFTEDYTRADRKDIDLLLGSDYLYDLLTDRTIRGPSGKPVAVETLMGWTLHGPYQTKDFSQRHKANVYHVMNCQVINDEELTSAFKDLVSLEAVGIKPAIEQEESWLSVTISNGRFVTSLPWKGKERPQCNFMPVSKRQNNMLARLTPNQKVAYDDYFMEYEQLGIIEPSPSCSEHETEAWYLPHHIVTKTTKRLRIVFDGSYGNPSLNDMLVTGPNLLTQIPACLTSFRLFEIPLTADIEKAFLQVEIVEQDRNFLQFLWHNKSYRFCRLPFGLTSSPAILTSCLVELYKQWENIYPETTAILKQSMYMDDLVSSCPTADSCDTVKQQSQEIFSSVHMNLRDWSHAPKRVLGIPYEKDNDCLIFNLDCIATDEKTLVTRRQLVSKVASLYDPLGLLAPWLVRGKLIISRSWDEHCQWDDAIAPDLQLQWSKLVEESKRTSTISVSRHLYFTDGAQLHIFSDASLQIYAACVYLVTASHSELVFSRNRLAPKSLVKSAPRMELLAAWLASRMSLFLTEALREFKNIEIYFWSDSTCTLSRIRENTSSMKQFERNRVQAIRSVSGEWNYCPGVDNPADLATRGLSAAQLMCSKLWFHGPSWLMDPNQWPKTEQDQKTKDKEMELSMTVVTQIVDAYIEQFLLRFSTLQRAIATLAWILRLKQSHNRTATLSFTERQQAFQKIVSQVQKSHFFVEYQTLSQGDDISRTSPLCQLRPKWDEELEVIMGVPRNGEPMKILLPAKSHLTTLLIWESHLSLHHAGTTRVLVALQQKFWIPKLRRVTQKQLKTCVSCQRHHGHSYQQREAFLAPFRREPTQPFAHTGLDFAGPLYTKDGEKRYILLFVCGSVRALHLELTTDMTLESTSLAVRRFQARRGTITMFYSDNAPTFRKLASISKLPWTTIPEHAPWWGGWWERMVGSIKTALKKTLHLTPLSMGELSTILTEVEYSINCRPLTYVADTVDSPKPLRPIDFLIVEAPVGDPGTTPSQRQYNARWAYRKTVLEHLMKRWKEEYFASLRSWRCKRSPGKVPVIGDIVLVKETASRNSWPLARIEKLLPSKDGVIRAAVITLRQKQTRRPTSLLFPLESEPPWQGLPPLCVDVSKEAHKDKRDEPPSTSPIPITTRYGRQIKPPTRLDL